MENRQAISGLNSVSNRSSRDGSRAATVGMARWAVPARVQRVERMRKDVRTRPRVAPLNAARTAQRAVPTTYCSRARQN
jgi:hypothetical protein